MYPSVPFAEIESAEAEAGGADGGGMEVEGGMGGSIVTSIAEEEDGVVPFWRSARGAVGTFS